MLIQAILLVLSISECVSTFTYHRFQLNEKKEIIASTNQQPPTTQHSTMLMPRTATCKADLHILLDASTSVQHENFRKQLDFVKNIVNSSQIGSDAVRVGITTFSTRVHNEFFMSLYNNKTKLIDAIDNIIWSQGYTRTDLALDYARQYAFTTANGGRDGVRNVLLVLTDGQSTGPSLTETAAQAIHATGAQVLVVGISRGINKAELRAIASSPASVLEVPDFDALTNIQTLLLDQICPTITTTLAPSTTSTSLTTTTAAPCPVNPCQHGAACTLSGSVMTCHCPAGWTAIACQEPDS